MPSKKAAIILCGCGRADGSEIHESVSILIHLSRLGVEYKCFAPDAPQPEVVNHATNKPLPTSTATLRNMLVESARISRGDITPLDQLDPGVFDMVLFPGGFGAAKNLCNFASRGNDCEVLPDVARVIKAFHAAKKPIGLCCIAPVLAARVLGTRKDGPGCKVTIGSDAKTADAVALMGSVNVPKGVTEEYTDTSNRVVTTPAYMCDARPHEVFEGIGRMVEKTVALAGAA